jgi:hypothetical protein
MVSIEGKMPEDWSFIYGVKFINFTLVLFSQYLKAKEEYREIWEL